MSFIEEIDENYTFEKSIDFEREVNEVLKLAKPDES